LKGSQHFRAGFRDLASAIITADSPGLTTLDVTVFDHPNANRALWPIDPHLEWDPKQPSTEAAHEISQA
jgi:microcystin degradation protein MlrC